MTAEQHSKSTLEQLWEFWLYAPIGLMFSLRDLAPELVNKGRQQVNTARFVGTVAGRKINKLVHAEGNPTPASPDNVATGSVKATRPALASSSNLALEDYDTLAASHIVARLESLSAADLEAIHAYESAGRGRRTILAKIQQLRPS